jgi:hypothetical protein
VSFWIKLRLIMTRRYCYRAVVYFLVSGPVNPNPEFLPRDYNSSETPVRSTNHAMVVNIHHLATDVVSKSSEEAATPSTQLWRLDSPWPSSTR